MSNQLQTHAVTETMDLLESDNLAPLLFAGSGEQASRYCSALEDVNIPVVIGDHKGKATKGLGMPLLVPESFHEHASEIISSLDLFDSDYEFDDEDDDEDEDDDDDFLADDDDDFLDFDPDDD
ncbi:MAG: hypothetical protein JSU63_07660 [Phycisphaerales bacterium]|nr:MAG: hypothetical protein JSU63_07660 [Phycisphaerales bacterium]